MNRAKLIRKILIEEKEQEDFWRRVEEDLKERHLSFVGALAAYSAERARPI